MTAEEKTKKVITYGSLGSSIGLVGGLIYAFKNKKSFWGYVGYGLLFSTIGYTALAVPAFVLIKEDKATDNKTKKDTTTSSDKTATTDNSTTDANLDAKKIITKEKATELLKFYANKKKEMEVSKYADGGKQAQLVLNSLKKSIEDGGWKVVEKDGKISAVKS